MDSASWIRLFKVCTFSKFPWDFFPTEIPSKKQCFPKPGWWSPDFWTINSIMDDPCMISRARIISSHQNFEPSPTPLKTNENSLKRSHFKGKGFQVFQTTMFHLDIRSFSAGVTSNRHVSTRKLHGSLYYQPKQCIVIREIPQNYHRCVSLDSPHGNFINCTVTNS